MGHEGQQINMQLHGLCAAKISKIWEITKDLHLGDEILLKVADKCEKEVVLGLSSDDPKKKGSLLMMNTYITSLINGTERGHFLALDLGGTQFRVLYVTLTDHHEAQTQVWRDEIPPHVLTAPSRQVFNYIAESIYKFQKENNRLKEHVPLGFTFSFPMIQEALNIGRLVTWTKSFKCPDGVGQDAAALLEQALREKSMDIPVVAILNDTSGVLMAGSYQRPDTSIGLILGTGCNSCYVESTDNIHYKHDLPPGTQVVIDTESGGLGDDGCLDFIQTKFDRVIDQHSNHPGSYTFEKLFSGHYIGELFRLVLLELTRDNLLFSGTVTDRLKTQRSIMAAHMSAILEKDSGCSDFLHYLGVGGVAHSEDVAVLTYVCKLLSVRGAHLVAAKLVPLVKRVGKRDLSIAVDGSLYEKHPHFKEDLDIKLRQMVPNVNCKFFHVSDGSGLGAAFTAAVAERLAR